MEKVLIPLIIIAAVILGILIIVMIIKNKLSSMTHRYLGMGLNQTADTIFKGIKEESTMPKPVSNMTAVYKPKIERDFPEVGYLNMENMAKNGMINVMNAIEAEDVGKLSDASPRLVRQVENTIEDNRSAGKKAYYDDIKVHKISASGYSKTASSAKADFEMSFQAHHYAVKDGKTVEGSKQEFSQYSSRISLTYNQEEYLETTDIFRGSNCPNCGAPVSAVGNDKHCPYCGSGLTVIADRIWQIDSFSLLK